jgi:spermidine/putrescine transport system ATP-binding protein
VGEALDVSLTPDQPSETSPGAAAVTASGEVELRGITHRYGTTVAVDDLSLRIEAGTFASLLGPSGCGKTTTLRVLAGFETPHAGRVLISGVDVTDVPPNRRRVNTVFQHYALFPHLDVSGNIAYGLKRSGVPKAEARKRVGDVLDLVHLTHLANRRPDELSGGQRQRVALARAIVNRPPVLLLDEPLSALDRALREDMQVELKLLQRELGTTFVFVTHDQDEAMALSDHVVVMEHGTIAQQGTPSEVYDHPESLFTAMFVGKQNVLPGISVREGCLVGGSTVIRAGQIHGVITDGSPVTAVVRPFAVRVTDHAPDEPDNAVPGRISTVSDIGDIRQVVIRTDVGEVLAWSTRSADSEAPMPGSGAWCTWQACDTHLYAGHPERSGPVAGPS